MTKNRKMLEEGSFGELLLKLSLPSVVVILIMVVYNVADTYFIGQTGDPNKISAISLCMPVFTILSGIGTLFGNGGTTSISIALGAKNDNKVRHVTAFCLLGCLVVGLVFFAVVFFFTKPLALLLGADASTMDFSITYLKTFCFASPLVLFSTTYGSIIRADGDAAVAMIPNLAGTISNIVLDALFILVFGWDVFGAAFATVLGNVISCILLIIILHKRKKIFLPSLKQLSFDSDVVVPVLTLGLPMTFSTILGSVSNTLQNRLMMVHGSTYLAAQSVAGKINMIITMLIMGFCMGMQPVISYNFGGKNYKRMYKVVKSTGLFTVVLGIILTIVVFFFKDSIVAAFIDNEEVIACGQIFVLASVIIGPIYGIYQLSQTFLQSTGKVTYAIFSSLLDKGLIFIPVLYLMDHFWAAYGIAFSHAVTMIFSFVVALILAMCWAKQIQKL